MIKDELDHSEERFAQILQIFCQKGQTRIRDKYFGSDLAKTFRFLPDSDPEHWVLEDRFKILQKGQIWIRFNYSAFELANKKSGFYRIRMQNTGYRYRTLPVY
jgi:hypothetical protein